MILEQLIKLGKIWVEGREYVGLAEDGTIVSVGNVGQEEQAEKYLAAHPTPDTW
jgi:hypothetical protein